MSYPSGATSAVPLSILTLLLFSTVATSLQVSYQTRQLLSKCEREGKTICDVPVIPNENDINDAIQKSSYLSQFSNSNYNRLQSRHARRAKRESVAELCTSSQNFSDPFSFVRSADGWAQVATTNAYPQRVIFAMDKCTRPNAPCRGVSSLVANAIPICYQEFRQHTILTFNETTKNVATRYVTLPYGCKCKLEVRSLIDSPMGWSEPEPRGIDSGVG